MWFKLKRLNFFFKVGVFGQPIVADPPVGPDRSVEDIQRHFLRIESKVGCHKGWNHHILAVGTKSWRVPNLVQVIVVIELILSLTYKAPAAEEGLPNGVGVGAVIVHKCCGPSHHCRCEVPGFVGRFVDVVLQVVVVAKEALVVLADVAVRCQLQLQVPDGLQTGTGVEVLAVRLRVLVVQVGLLHQPLQVQLQPTMLRILPVKILVLL